MKPTSEKPSEDKSKLKQEMEAAEKLHEVLLSLPEDRRGPAIKAIAILLRIYIPNE